jgi:tRNA pseudouridine38-40 synthase
VSRTLKLTIQYDGTDLVGWQRQKTGDSVQGQLEAALARIDGAAVTVHGAGRTDAGVHAIAQVASAQVQTAHEPATLVRALNAQLPEAVRVVGVEDAASDFHARFSARGKTYRYLMLEGDTASPFLRRYVHRVVGPLDVDAMREAARAFPGTHDFSAFQSTGSTVAHAMRTVTRADVWIWQPGQPPPAPPVTESALAGGRLVVFEVSADGFLRHMVRAMAGTLLDVGQRRRPASDVSAVRDGLARADAGATAPACGLWLVSVDYC